MTGATVTLHVCAICDAETHRKDFCDKCRADPDLFPAARAKAAHVNAAPPEPQAVQTLPAAPPMPVNPARDLREAWLERAIDALRPWFYDAGHPLPATRVSVGFGGGKKGALGTCWASSCADDQARHIFISPCTVDVVSEGASVLKTLLHELCHAALPDDAGHKGTFVALARQFGFVKPFTVCGAHYPEMEERLRPIADALGPYPHAALNPSAIGAPKKQKTRMIRCMCETCGYTARTTAKWIQAAGAPHCPDHGAMITAE